MNSIKSKREELGFTQQTLSEVTGLSLRTIQRLEAGNKEPKGHSLNVLAKAFGMSSADLKSSFHPTETAEKDEQLSISFINLSALGFLFLPLGNILFPYLVWKRKRSFPTVDEAGRRVLNFQIIWTAIFFLSLIIAPFLDNGQFPFQLILMVLFFMMALNVIVIFYTAFLIQKGRDDFLNLPIRLI